MTKESLARQLDGGEIDAEINAEKEQEAKAAGLVVVFGDSGDNIAIRGALRDEIRCSSGGTFMIDAKGVLADSWEDVKDDEQTALDWVSRKDSAATIAALWRKEGEYVWAFQTHLPHSTFEITEEGRPFCRGIVFNLADLSL